MPAKANPLEADEDVPAAFGHDNPFAADHSSSDDDDDDQALGHHTHLAMPTYVVLDQSAAGQADLAVRPASPGELSSCSSSHSSSVRRNNPYGIRKRSSNSSSNGSRTAALAATAASRKSSSSTTSLPHLQLQFSPQADFLLADERRAGVASPTSSTSSTFDKASGCMLDEPISRKRTPFLGPHHEHSAGGNWDAASGFGLAIPIQYPAAIDEKLHSGFGKETAIQEHDRVAGQATPSVAHHLAAKNLLEWMRRIIVAHPLGTPHVPIPVPGGTRLQAAACTFDSGALYVTRGAIEYLDRALAGSPAASSCSQSDSDVVVLGCDARFCPLANIAADGGVLCPKGPECNFLHVRNSAPSSAALAMLQQSIATLSQSSLNASSPASQASPMPSPMFFHGHNAAQSSGSLGDSAKPVASLAPPPPPPPPANDDHLTPAAHVNDPTGPNIFEMLPAGVTLVVYPPNNAAQPPQSISSDKILLTAGGSNVYHVLRNLTRQREAKLAECGGSLPPVKQPHGLKPRHCAHFQFKRICNLGKDCNFIHSLVPCGGHQAPTVTANTASAATTSSKHRGMQQANVSQLHATETPNPVVQGPQPPSPAYSFPVPPMGLDVTTGPTMLHTGQHLYATTPTFTTAANATYAAQNVYTPNSNTGHQYHTVVAAGPLQQQPQQHMSYVIATPQQRTVGDMPVATYHQQAMHATTLSHPGAYTAYTTAPAAAGMGGNHMFASGTSGNAVSYDPSAQYPSSYGAPTQQSFLFGGHNHSHSQHPPRAGPFVANNPHLHAVTQQHTQGHAHSMSQHGYSTNGVNPSSGTATPSPQQGFAHSNAITSPYAATSPAFNSGPIPQAHAQQTQITYHQAGGTFYVSQ